MMTRSPSYNTTNRREEAHSLPPESQLRKPDRDEPDLAELNRLRRLIAELLATNQRLREAAKQASPQRIRATPEDHA